MPVVSFGRSMSAHSPAVAAVNNDYNWGELHMEYRYIHYDFDSSLGLLSELDVDGLCVGAGLSF